MYRSHGAVARAGVQLAHRIGPQSAAQPTGVCLCGRADIGEARAGLGCSRRRHATGRADVVGVDGAPAVFVRSLIMKRLLVHSTRLPTQRTHYAKQDAEPARPSKAVQYSGWKDSLEVLLAALKTHAPVDGLLGASSRAKHVPNVVAIILRCSN